GKATDASPPPAAELRRNFAETAVFAPHLTVDKNGEAQLRFEVPDSVTAWKAHFHALTQSLMVGSHVAEIKTVKELMVRPNMPRFMRENDETRIRVIVNNGSTQAMSGELTANLIHPETKASLNSQ